METTLKNRLEAAVALDECLVHDVRIFLNLQSKRDGELAGTEVDFAKVFSWAETVHPGFIYLCWRNKDGRHHCSLALDEQDLDSHRWLGAGASIALAMAAALVASIDRPAGRH